VVTEEENKNPEVNQTEPAFLKDRILFWLIFLYVTGLGIFILEDLISHVNI
jgi:hypothetical protein